jgi:hypothetical protein
LLTNYSEQSCGTDAQDILTIRPRGSGKKAPPPLVAGEMPMLYKIITFIVLFPLMSFLGIIYGYYIGGRKRPLTFNIRVNWPFAVISFLISALLAYTL